jgi:sigma-E factor negative regulatory protein RseB
VTRAGTAAVLCSAALCLVAQAVQAQSAEGLTWLRKIAQATRTLSYSGTFVYQQGGRSETSRITRLAPADIERLEVLDGLPRELIRTRESVRCYLPESRLIKVEKRVASAVVDRGFPTVLPEQLGALAEHYDVSLGETSRIGGFECQAVVLTPRDNLRYGYRLYADVNSGMLVRAVTLDADGHAVEQFRFTQLRIGHVTADMVKPRSAARRWRIEDTEAAPAHLAGWGLSAELPGFHKVMELKRRMGESRPVGQVVYSDGLAAVSVFIEPLQPRQEPPRTGLASLGAINIYTREVANHMVTVVGEAPAASVQRIGNAVEYRRP